jgi:uncharacterized protein
MNSKTSLPQSLQEWHPGERALQRLAGSEATLAPYAARILRPSMTAQLQQFFPLLPFIIVSYTDADSQPWGSILPGPPGFAWSPAPDILRIDRLPPDGDPLAAALRPGAPIGLLGIELPTRRRNRVNGVVAAVDDIGFTVTVQQAYGNCPKYIQQRAYAGMDAPPAHVDSTGFTGLDDAAARILLSQADTIFVASFAPGPDGTPAMDISHRGGRPGFLKLEDGVITIPDFSGNGFFNTLGNILVTGRAGLVIPDFLSGDLLTLTGTAELGLDGASLMEADSVGAERLWRLRPLQGRWLRHALPLALELKGWSPFTLATGAWPNGDTA